MTEHTLLDALLTTLREALPDAVITKHADGLTAGTPDFSVVWKGRTSWWETKLATPLVHGTGLQHLTMRRLAAHGDAWYVIWRKEGSVLTTNIVRPRDLSALGRFSALHERDDISNTLVLSFVKQLHQQETLTGAS